MPPSPVPTVASEYAAETSARGQPNSAASGSRNTATVPITPKAMATIAVHTATMSQAYFIAEMSRCAWLAAPGQKHADLLAVAAVALAELRHQVALLEPDADQDVAGPADREQQVAGGHDRRRPHAEDEAEVDGVAHVAVEERRPEFRLRDLAACKAREHLAQAEQLEVIDEEGGEEQYAPAQPEDR